MTECETLPLGEIAWCFFSPVFFTRQWFPLLFFNHYLSVLVSPSSFVTGIRFFPPFLLPLTSLSGRGATSSPPLHVFLDSLPPTELCCSWLCYCFLCCSCLSCFARPCCRCSQLSCLESGLLWCVRLSSSLVCRRGWLLCGKLSEVGDWFLGHLLQGSVEVSVIKELPVCVQREMSVA